MPGKAFACTLLLVPCLALGVQAQTYQIKLKEYGAVGKKVNVQVKDATKEMIKVSVQGNLVKEELKDELKEESYTDVVLEDGGPHPKKFKRIYTTAKTTRGGKEDTTAYHGRTVIFELENTKYKVTAEKGVELGAAEVMQLEKQANDKLLVPMEKLLPRKEVAVGDTWKVDPAVIAKIFGEGTKVDVSKSTAQGKLTKAYKKDGHQFGVIQYTFKLAMVDLGGLKLPNPIMLTLNMTLDTAIDGSSTAGTLTANGSMQGKGTIEQGGQTVMIDLNIHTNGSQVQSAEQ